METINSNISEQLAFWSNPFTWINSKNGETWSTSFGGTTIMWTGFIKPRIKDYLKGDILEIGPGYGRVTKFLLRECKSLEVVDITQACLNEITNKFGEGINCIKGNGHSLEGVEDESKDLVFSWSSFIHIHQDVTKLYLDDIYRVLRKGGSCFIHHSFLMGGSDTSFQNKAGRSNMDPGLFKDLAEERGFTVTDQESFQHYVNGSLIWDTVSTIQK